jgi:hypothetical protein
MPKRRNTAVWWLALVLATVFSLACNRLGAAGGQEKTASGRNLPFHPGSGPDVATDSATDGEGSSPGSKDGLPFHSSSHHRILPSGTLLTVRLERSLDSAEVHPGDPFAAVVAEPIMIEGDTVVARNVAVTGAIESSQEASAQSNAGYIRLTLNAMTIDGKRLPLQTSSLFARGAAAPSGNQASLSGIRLAQGRRLTFRLAVPASLDGQEPIASGQDSAPSAD